jgi:hypothetical protein
VVTGGRLESGPPEWDAGLHLTRPRDAMGGVDGARRLHCCCFFGCFGLDGDA